jgi:hypothetical protein
MGERLKIKTIKWCLKKIKVRERTDDMIKSGNDWTSRRTETAQ